MQISGKVHKIGGIINGKTRNGKEFQRREFVISFELPYGDKPGYLAFGLFGSEKVAIADDFHEGDMVKVSFDAKSREYNGKWYTDLNAWKIESVGEAISGGGVSSTSESSAGGEDMDDDLPF